MQAKSTDHFFQSNVFGHPSALFVLFFTEMWERFSYYGMRAIFVLFLTSALIDGGWAWERADAMKLYAMYTSLVYISPIIGGYIADKIIGYRAAVIIGALIMTMGHASMSMETPTFLYIGVALLIVGNGFFKPNITSIISNMYKDRPQRKDGAYTIFYMGVNAGAFLGILLCGYIGEKVGWSLGFGLAGIFMFFGMLQFAFARKIFGKIGDPPSKDGNTEEETELAESNSEFVLDDTTDLKKSKLKEAEKRNPFTLLDKILIVLSGIGGIVWAINGPLETGGLEVLGFKVGPYNGSDFVIILSLAMFAVLVISRIVRYTAVVRDKMIAVAFFAFLTVFFWASFEQAGGSMTIFAADYTNRELVGSAAMIFKVFNAFLTIIPLGIITYVLIKLFQQTFGKIPISNIILGFSFLVIWGVVIWMIIREFSGDATEIPASWFAILNSFFIISLAPLFSRWWDSKYNPFATVKYGLGLILLGVGFGILALGSSTIPQGAATASVSMVWLVLAYLFHTLGELCLSPVGLSYVSKLVPGRMIAFMFGVWYLAVAIGNNLAGQMGALIDPIVEEYSMSTFFLIFTLIPVGMGLIAILLSRFIKKFMHGVH